jgi:hypothetical protein
VVALLLADPGEDLPRQLVLGADLLVDREHPRGHVARGNAGGRVANTVAAAALADDDGEECRAARQ